MKDVRRIGTTWIWIAAGVLALGSAYACAPKAGRRQTDVMEKAGGVSVSAAVLRARVNDLANRMAGRIEYTADRIREGTQDRAVRRRALGVKVNTMPAVYTAAFRADPLESAVDVWALAFQVAQYVGDGEGRDAFGPQQPLAREAARALLADADALIRSITTGPEAFASARARVERWAMTHPVEQALASRASIAPYMAELRSGERDAFVAVGEVSETIESLSQRVNTYAAVLPRQARWQAEILLADTTGDHDLETALGDIHAVGTTARTANELLGDVPRLLGAEGSPVREMLAAERRAVLEGVNGQRVQTLEYLTAERLAVLAAAREERIALEAALHQERIETLKEADAIKSRAVESALVGLRDLFDYALWRVAALFMFFMLSAATLGVVGYWLTLGRRRNAVTP